MFFIKIQSKTIKREEENTADFFFGNIDGKQR